MWLSNVKWPDFTGPRAGHSSFCDDSCCCACLSPQLSGWVDYEAYFRYYAKHLSKVYDRSKVMFSAEASSSRPPVFDAVQRLRNRSTAMFSLEAKLFLDGFWWCKIPRQSQCRQSRDVDGLPEERWKNTKTVNGISLGDEVNGVENSRPKLKQRDSKL